MHTVVFLLGDGWTPRDNLVVTRRSKSKCERLAADFKRGCAVCMRNVISVIVNLPVMHRSLVTRLDASSDPLIVSANICL